MQKVHESIVEYFDRPELVGCIENLGKRFSAFLKSSDLPLGPIGKPVRDVIVEQIGRREVVKSVENFGCHLITFLKSLERRFVSIGKPILEVITDYFVESERIKRMDKFVNRLVLYLHHSSALLCCWGGGSEPSNAPDLRSVTNPILFGAAIARSSPALRRPLHATWVRKLKIRESLIVLSLKRFASWQKPGVAGDPLFRVEFMLY
jgi:hypothetical protein